MVFVLKRCLSIFSHWLVMERSQNWHDRRSPIAKFRDINTFHGYRWKFQGDRSFGIAMTSIQTFSDVKSLDVIWPWVTWIWNFHNMCGKDVWPVNRCAKYFFDICEKSEGATKHSIQRGLIPAGPVLARRRTRRAGGVQTPPSNSALGPRSEMR